MEKFSMDIKQLTPELWVGQSKLYFTNAGIFINDGKACLIDPCMLPDELDAIIQFIKDQQLEVDSILLTHSHWDHILGPEWFPGVRTIAQANYVKQVAEPNGKIILRQIKQWEQHHNVERDKPFEIPQPDEVFGQEHTLSVGSVQLQLLAVPGHASDQLAAYDAGQKILWASDILSDVEIPFISHSIVAYEKTLDMLADLEVEVLIPGHGHPSTSADIYKQRVKEDRQYLSELRRYIEGAIQDGLNAEETFDLCAGIEYRNFEENISPHKANVESVYIELGGSADPTKYGWGKIPEGTD
jgi:glyoxylase-like metal-dependent hydrolase (beta-lactamase superfamily II)